MSLEEYRRKRRPGVTPEPLPGGPPGADEAAGEKLPVVEGAAADQPHATDQPDAAHRFVIHKHDASRLHYDLRLEHDGVLKSWAVPKGLATPHDPRKLAVQVEDHPLEYIDFQGEIPKGEYGAGQVEIWDEGVYEQVDDFTAGLESGKLTFRLRGAKVEGEFSLVRMKGKEAARGGGSAGAHRTTSAAHRSEGTRAHHAPGNKGSDWLILLHKHVRLDPDLAVEETPAKQPRQVEPMKAVLGDRPFDCDEFVYEIKFDGVRAVAFIFADGAESIQSRNRKELAAAYPELADLGSHFLAAEVIADGEIVALDERGVSSFQLLQSRLNLSNAAEIKRAAGAVPVYLYLFDLLFLNGRDLTGLPLSRRRQILERIFIPGKYIRLTEPIERQGKAFFAAAAQAGLEGIMAKRKDSAYLQKRSRDWIKLKAVKEQEFVIGGYTAPRGRRSGFGALLIGYYERSRLIYAGHVGSGFSEDALASLMKRMEKLKRKTSPFAEEPTTNQPATWVKPQLVAEVKFAEWTREGSLRQPVFLGLRDDKDPREVVREDGAAEAATSQSAATHDFATSHRTHRTTNKSRPARPQLARPLPDISGARQEVKISGRRLGLTHLDKVFWPEQGHTKRDLINYYHRVSAFIVPHLKGRPLTLKRYPDGYGSKPFFQKEAPAETPGWVRTEVIPADNPREKIRYIVCDEEPTLLFLANIACISQNPWLSRLPALVRLDPAERPTDRDRPSHLPRLDALDRPDQLVLDIDPPGPGHYDQCVEVALVIRDVLTDFGLKGYPKTSGATGIHVYVPIKPLYSYEQARQFAQVIASLCREERPDLITLETATGKRQGKIYLDYLQNVRGKTVASVYSVRAQAGAPVSTPLEWREVRRGLRPGDFTIANVPERLEKKGDLFAGVLEEKQDLLEALKL